MPRILLPFGVLFQPGDLHLEQRRGLPRRECQTYPHREQIDSKISCTRCGMTLPLRCIHQKCNYKQVIYVKKGV